MSLHRSKKNRKVAGCCGGLGETIGMDPTLLRILFFWVCILTGILPAVLVYFIWMIFVPLRDPVPGATAYKKIFRSKKRRIFGGVIGGFAEYTGISVEMLRFVYAVVAIFSAFVLFLLLYLSMWVMIPDKPKPEDVEIEIT